MRGKLISILVTTLTVSATAAFGAVKDGDFSVTPTIGGYIYDNGQQLKSTLVMGVRAGYNITKEIGVEALYDYVIPTDSKNWSYAPTGSGFWSLSNISMHRFGGQVLYHFVPDRVLVPYLAAGFSGIKFSGNGVTSRNQLAFDYGAGTKYFLTNDIAVRGDIRHILYSYDSTTANNVEFTLGAHFQFGGVTPPAKAVAAAPEQTSQVEPPEAAAVPAPVAAAEPAKAAAPAPAPEPVKAAAPQFVVPEAVPVFVKLVGENAPESEQFKAVAAPLPAPAAVLQPHGSAVQSKVSSAQAGKQFCNKNVKTTVLFDANKAELKARYHKKLNEMGALLKKYPDSKVTISGHTAAVGNSGTSFEFSQVRADSLKNYIINKFGIDSSRIITKGFGSGKPAATNKTSAGRSKNRRLDVVFSCE